MEPFIDKSGYSPKKTNPDTAKGVGAAEWLSTHLYTSACIAAGMLLIIGAVVVKNHLPESASNTLQVWGGGQGTLINSASYQPQNPALSNMSANAPDPSSSITLTPIPVAKPPVSDTGTNDSFDIQAWAASIKAGMAPAGAGTPSANTTINSSYEFIPQGLLSTSSPGRERTALQKALYEYGNNAGSYIQTYETAHQNTAPTLRDQSVDRQNVQKGRAVKAIGDALKAVGVSLQHMDGVPPGVDSLNQTLAKGYIDIGEKLSAVPDASGDAAFIAAIKTYDASVEAFTKDYVALAQYLSLSGVTFSSIDPGSVFTFSGGGGI